MTFESKLREVIHNYGLLYILTSVIAAAMEEAKAIEKSGAEDDNGFTGEGNENARNMRETAVRIAELLPDCYV